MEELDEGRYNVKPSSPELAVEIVNGSFAWDSLSSEKTSYVARLRTSACRRRGHRSRVKPRRHRDDDADDADEDARPDPVALLYEAVFSRDDSPDILFDINFTAAKVTTALSLSDNFIHHIRRRKKQEIKSLTSLN